MEKAILVGLHVEQSQWNIEETMRELVQLTETAGAEAVAEVIQKRPRPDSRFYVGRGKAEEIKLLLEETGADIVIFDDELSPSQKRNLEETLGVLVVDRTALILDIFAQRAKTREGILQVELAQLNYTLPRLSGIGTELSRLGGGIGTRGPGETKLEVDRRRIRRRIADLKQQIEEIRKHRSLHRKARKAVPLPVVTLVGYTNAGKSTLLNSLTDAGVFAEDKLFATLDPTTRQVELTNGSRFLLTDTVGFIQKLPHHLVAAFRSTLEEVLEADLLLHVVDASHPQAAEQMVAVYEILTQLHAQQLPTLVVFNKMDLPESAESLAVLGHGSPEHIAVSAKKKIGLDHLLQKVDETLRGDHQRIQLDLPFGQEKILAVIRHYGKLESEEYSPEGIRVSAVLPKAWAEKIKHSLGKGAAEIAGDEELS
jgi:GTP-binding protein HflX